jgi:uncharacterized protein YcfL
MKRCSSFQSSLVFLALIILVGCSRSSGPRRLLEFKVEFGDNDIPAQMTARRTATADITIKNTSKNKWSSKSNDKGRNAVNLSYHWFDRKGAVVVFDGLRTPLPNDVQPGESVQLRATIQPPDRAGQYTLEVTLVQETVAWFPERNGDKLTRSVNVINSNAEVTSVPAANAVSPHEKAKKNPGRVTGSRQVGK